MKIVVSRSLFLIVLVSYSSMTALWTSGSSSRTGLAVLSTNEGRASQVTLAPGKYWTITLLRRRSRMARVMARSMESMSLCDQSAEEPR